MEKSIRAKKKGNPLLVFLKNVFLPGYDELSVFMVCFFFIITMVEDGACREDFFGVFRFRYSDGVSTIYEVVIASLFAIFLLLGTLVSVYAVMNKGKKSPREQFLLKMSQLLLSAFIGIKGLEYLVVTDQKDMLIIPLINIVTALYYWVSLVLKELDRFNQKDAGSSDLLFSLSIGLLLFFHFKTNESLHWSIFLSLSVSYAQILNAFVVFSADVIYKSFVRKKRF